MPIFVMHGEVSSVMGYGYGWSQTWTAMKEELGGAVFSDLGNLNFNVFFLKSS